MAPSRVRPPLQASNRFKELDYKPGEPIRSWYQRLRCRHFYGAIGGKADIEGAPACEYMA